MSWRSIQLGNELCDQDQLILSLFDDAVAYYGIDQEFAELLNKKPNADNLILIINSPVWVSSIIEQISSHLNSRKYKKFYIGINRYQILGNDTNLNLESSTGININRLLSAICKKYGYTVAKSGHMDDDGGKYFNFVQPLTWIYGTY